MYWGRLAAAGAGLLGGLYASVATAGSSSNASPIKHVIILLQENHSFDNVLGAFCAEVSGGELVRPGYDSKCDGATTGDMAGKTVRLTEAADIVPNSSHTVQSQQAAIDSGKMDGFASTDYTQFDPQAGPCAPGSCIPNLGKLATRYTVSDRTFELNSSPSFGGHLAFAAATQDGFYGDIPARNTKSGPQPHSTYGGWGCDSGDTTPWSAANVLVPSCVPDSTGSLGPNWVGYTGQHAAYVPTIFDELSAKKIAWRIYGGTGAGAPTVKGGFASGYNWDMCPIFADCEYTSERNHLVPSDDIVSDATAGKLPAFAIVTPTAANSQHNTMSMSTGDNWIGTIISAIQHGPDWPSTAIFVTYDDCGCFYDHVNPLQFNPTWGIRVPLVIVSPFAKLGYTDSTPTSFAGVLSFVEQTLGLAALNSNDGDSYGYASAFCFNQASGCTPAGTSPVSMIRQWVSPPTPAERQAQAVAAHDDT